MFLHIFSPNHDYDDPEFGYYSTNGARRVPPAPPPTKGRSPFYEEEGAVSTDDGDDGMEGSTPRGSLEGHHRKEDRGRDFENFRVTIKNAHNQRQQRTEAARGQGKPGRCCNVNNMSIFVNIEKDFVLECRVS